MDVPLLAAPHRQRRAPVALARERPVDVVAQPVAEPPLLDVRRVPRDGVVGREQLVAELRGGDVPGRFGVVDQRVLRAPAVRVGVLVLLRSQQQPGRVEVVDQLLGERLVLDVPALVGGAAATADAPSKVPSGSTGFRSVAGSEASKMLGFGGDAEIVLAEGGSEVDDARAVVGGDELVGEDRVARARPDVEDGPLIAAEALAQLGAGVAVEHLHVIAEHGGDAVRRQHVPLRPVGDRRVLGSRRDGERDVAGQRPGRRRPDQQALLAAGDLQLHVHARVDHVAIAECDLVRGQRGLAAGAVRDDLAPLVEQPPLVDLRERPPDGLDVALIQRAVRRARDRPRTRSARSAGPTPSGRRRRIRGSAR